jgi:hypothetical protein
MSALKSVIHALSVTLAAAALVACSGGSQPAFSPLWDGSGTAREPIVHRARP